MSTYLYIHPGLHSISRFQDAALQDMTERHYFRLPVLPLRETGDLGGEIDSSGEAGVVFGIEKGLPSRRQLQLAGRALRRGRAVYFYWPFENAAEVVDSERLSSFWRHWIAYMALNRFGAAKSRFGAAKSRFGNASSRLRGLLAHLSLATYRAEAAASALR